MNCANIRISSNVFTLYAFLFLYRCSLFLWDKERDELVAKVFDGEIPTDGNDRKVCGRYNFSQGNFALSPCSLSLKWIFFCWGTEGLKGINGIAV